MSKKTEALSCGLTFHCPDSGALALVYGNGGDIAQSVAVALNLLPTGWASCAVKLDGRTLSLLAAHGQEAVCLGTVTTGGRFAKAGRARPEAFTMTTGARVALALEALAWWLNCKKTETVFNVEGWTRCEGCGRMMQKGTSIAAGMGAVCAAKGKTTDRDERKRAGLNAMQALIDARRG